MTTSTMSPGSTKTTAASFLLLIIFVYLRKSDVSQPSAILRRSAFICSIRSLISLSLDEFLQFISNRLFFMLQLFLTALLNTTPSSSAPLNLAHDLPAI